MSSRPATRCTSAARSSPNWHCNSARSDPPPARENVMSKMIHCVRIDVNGALTDVQLPAGRGLLEELRKQVDGSVEIARYVRPDGKRRLAIALASEGRDRKPQNLYATSLVNALYMRQ